MRLWITLEGRDVEIEFQAEDGKLYLDIEGHRAEADFRRLPDGEVYSLLVNGRSHEVRVTPAGERLEVTYAAVTHPVEVRHPLEKVLQSVRRAEAGRAGETIVAPMPGLVAALKVKPGDRVAAGQAVAVVEAMKMQNIIRAERDGVIAKVHVAAGASVAADEVMIELA
jgi:propionyl-CoA carboxylase alpha chain